MSSSGKPLGKVGSGFGLTTPAISQWPMVVSLPMLCSCRRAKAAAGASVFSPAVTPSMLNKPSLRRLGQLKLGWFAMAPRVLVPASPKAAASGSAPMPKLSSTIRKTRFSIMVTPFSGRSPEQYYFITPIISKNPLRCKRKQSCMFLSVFTFCSSFPLSDSTQKAAAHR